MKNKKKILAFLLTASLIGTMPCGALTVYADEAEVAAVTGSVADEPAEGALSDELNGTTEEALPETEVTQDNFTEEDRHISEDAAVYAAVNEKEAEKTLLEDTASGNSAVSKNNTISENSAASVSEDVVVAAGQGDSGMVTFDLSDVLIQEGGFPAAAGSLRVNGTDTEYKNALAYAIKEISKWNGEKEIKVDLSSYNLSMDQSKAICRDAINKHPEFFYLKSLMSWSNTAITLYAKDGYTVKMVAEFNNKTNSILYGVDNNWTDLQKVMYIHDYLVTHIQYDLSYSKYDAYNAIVEGSAVCQGYSLAFKYLTEKLGIECSCITSEAQNHAWDLITVDEKQYYIDCTWDDPVNGKSHLYEYYCGHENFLRSRDGMVGTGHNAGTDWVNEDGEKVYTGVAGDTAYDNAAWMKTNSVIPMIGDKGAYYVVNNSGSHTLYVYDFKNKNSTSLTSYNALWYVWGDGNSYITDSYSALGAIGNYYIATTPTEIYLISADNGNKKKIKTLTSEEKNKGYIYGALVEGSVLKYQLYTRYDSGMTGSGTVDLSSYDSSVRVTLNKEEAQININDKVQLTATVTPDSTVDKSVTWTSSDESIATVDSSGKVTGKKGGYAVITATPNAGGRSASCVVTVYQAVTGIEISHDGVSETMTTAPGYDKEYSFSATVTPSNATNNKINWTSSDESIVSFDSEGKPTAHKNGKVKITATADDNNSISKSFELWVFPFYSIEAVPSYLTLPEGKSYKLKPYTYPEDFSSYDAKDINLTWEYKEGDNSVISVDSEGNISFLKQNIEGDHYVTFEMVCNGWHSGKTTWINIVPANTELVSLNSINVSLAKSSIKVGDDTLATAKCDPSNAYNNSYYWKSSDTTVATINSYGIIYGKKAGTTVISAYNSYWDVTGSATLTVTDDSGNGGNGGGDNGNGDSESGTTPSDQTGKSYTVTFLSSDGNKVYYKETVAEGGNVVNLPSDPTDGGIFVGWYIDGKSIWNSSAPIVKDTKLYARFMANTASGNSSSGMDTAFSVVEGESFYLVKGQTYILDKNYVWTSSDTKALSIKSGYKMTAKKEADSISLTGKPNTQSSGAAGVEIKCKASIAEPKIDKKETVVVGHSEDIDLNLGSNASKYNVIWYSSNPAVAAVTDGKVYGVGKGSANVTAYVNGKALTCKVSVIEQKKIGKIDNELELEPLQTITLKFNDSFKAKNAKWTSDVSMNEITNSKGKIIAYQNGIVRITTAGKITGIGAGTASITGTSASGAVKTLKVTVNKTSERRMYLHANKSKKISILGVKAGNVDWTSSNTSIATVSKGKVKAFSEIGKATVSGNYDPYKTSKGFDYAIKTYVEKPEWAALYVNGNVTLNAKSATKYELKMKAGDTCLLKGFNIFEQVLFRSSKNDIAFVDEAGVVYARRGGKAKLTAKVAGKTYTINVIVSE